MREPENLEAVRPYANLLLQNAVHKRDYELGELTLRTFDTGDLADNLGTYASELHGILHDASTRICQHTLEAYELVDGLAEGQNGETLTAAFGASSLYRALEIIHRLPDQSAADALRVGLNHRVLHEAESASSLYRAGETIDNYATHQAKSAFKAARDARVFEEAQGASTLYRAGETIGNYATPATQTHMKVGRDFRVLAEATGATTLYRAAETTTNYASSKTMRGLIRLRLNGRVEQEALAANTCRKALDTVQNYGWGEAKTVMEKTVAGLWLPREEQSLAAAQRDLEEVKEELEQFNQLGFFVRMFRPVSRKDLKAALRINKLRITAVQGNIANLNSILQD